MFCPKCGSQNPDNAFRCVNCGQNLQPASQPPMLQQIPNYLVQSILVTLFCCLPFGIVSIVYAAQVNGKIQAGDIQGALAASKNAKMWSWISFGIGVVVVVLYVLLMIVGAAAGTAHPRNF